MLPRYNMTIFFSLNSFIYTLPATSLALMFSVFIYLETYVLKLRESMKTEKEVGKLLVKLYHPHNDIELEVI